jgi:hypothetical protein
MYMLSAQTKAWINSLPLEFRAEARVQVAQAVAEAVGEAVVAEQPGTE